MNDAELSQLITYSAVDSNILPITSRCDAHCIFCSHKNNPPDINVYSAKVRPLAEIHHTMAFLRRDRVITIGESASNIIEGEPFTHPQFAQILTTLRTLFPETPVSITTNGHHLTAETVGLLKRLGGVTLSVSINSASIEGRRILMGDDEEQSRAVIEGIRLLRLSGIGFGASMVAMPNITGWEDIENTILFLVENGASDIRVFMPSFSEWADMSLFPEPSAIYPQLREFIERLSKDLPCPVLLEPSYVRDLTPVISGVVKDSLAWKSGVRRGDVVLSVNGERPRCRVEAWNMLLPAGEHQVRLKSGGKEIGAVWAYDRDGGSGLTFEYDFDPRRAEELGRLINSEPGLSLLLTSEFGNEVVGQAVKLAGVQDGRALIIPVKNLTFGGSIKAAGLLTSDDYIAAFDSLGNTDAAQLILPSESFNSVGRDLKGRHYSLISERTGLPVCLC